MRFVVFCLFIASGIAADTGTLRGIVHDPQHRPLPGAQIVLRGPLPQTLTSDANGEFQVTNIPEGVYTVAVAAQGFQPIEKQVNVTAGKTPVLHLELELAGISTSVDVSGATSKLNSQASTVQTMVSPKEIEQTAGADQTNSLAMITDFTPGAVMVHDMLHMRGGHQVNWFFDGIPVVNTNIAANVAPLINPKNVEELEVERGGFSSEYGDRTYGFFNVVTPSGFERNNEINLIATAGNHYATDDQINIGSHTQRFAYYASIDGSRSELGLAPPISQVIHDQSSGVGGFLSLLYNPSAKDQFRWIASVREDHYQIPNLENDPTRDLDLEQDYLAGFHWTHSFEDGVTLTIAPYYHYNSAHFVGGPNDMPFVLNDNSRSNYFGGRSVVQAQKKKHNVRAGIEAWGQHDNTFFGLAANPGGGVLSQVEKHWANSTSLFLEDQYKATSWLTFDLGIRLTHYAGLINENAADPRLGASIRIPRINWVLHGYYAYYYQPPPLDSLAGPALDFAVSQGFGFIPLQGERDIQHDIGLSIPISGWTVDVDTFHTSARNFLDHDVIGDSGIFIPLTDLGAIISGTEVTLRSPRLFHIAQWRVAYSNQIGQGIGPITGGLLEDAPTGNFLLDHDQRNTVTSVLSLTLPGRMWATPAYQFGSGFLNGDGPSHLPPHSTFDLSIGKNFGEKWTISANAVNIANTRYLLDTSNTFGGTHFILPRQIYAELRYRFHF
ncbi:MAG TPA: TonB-dependent receptor [Bryobacteraceae bacterium]|jgi:outer membrane receptor protein involved in Fe transport|nr:TonB-dependent receptor [Bryobacteraceae bacterium]